MPYISAHGISHCILAYIQGIVGIYLCNCVCQSLVVRAVGFGFYRFVSGVYNPCGKLTDLLTSTNNLLSSSTQDGESGCLQKDMNNWNSNGKHIFPSVWKVHMLFIPSHDTGLTLYPYPFLLMCGISFRLFS